jgi:hypothetical protein
MERIRFTIHPPPSDDQGLLLVSDAMQQVIDYFKLLGEAARAMASPDESFEWRLEKASTNTPFTVVAVAEGRDPTVNVSMQVQRVKSAFSSGIRNLIERRELAWWMGPDAINLAQAVFARTQNGIWTTEIEVAANDTLEIDRAQAEAGINAIAGISAISLDADLAERTAFGEIEGLMVAAGRYRSKPAIQIRTEMYGYVWCQLSATVIDKFGTEHTMRDIWEGKTVGVQGRLVYAAGGKLSKIEVVEIREMPSVPRIDLGSVLDPDFTSGLDPVEYLRKLHEGELA